jgi:hypothetical protein
VLLLLLERSHLRGRWHLLLLVLRKLLLVLLLLLMLLLVLLLLLLHDGLTWLSMGLLKLALVPPVVGFRIWGSGVYIMKVRGSEFKGSGSRDKEAFCG